MTGGAKAAAIDLFVFRRRLDFGAALDIGLRRFCWRALREGKRAKSPSAIVDATADTADRVDSVWRLDAATSARSPKGGKGRRAAPLPNGDPAEAARLAGALRTRTKYLPLL